MSGIFTESNPRVDGIVHSIIDQMSRTEIDCAIFSICKVFDVFSGHYCIVTMVTEWT